MNYAYNTCNLIFSRKERVMITESQFRYVFYKLKQHDDAIDKLCKKYGIKKVNDVNIHIPSFEIPNDGQELERKSLENMINMLLEHDCVLNCPIEYYYCGYVNKVGLEQEQIDYIFQKLNEQDMNIERIRNHINTGSL